MIHARCLHKSREVISNGQRQLLAPLELSRNFTSSRISRTLPRSQIARSPLTRKCIPSIHERGPPTYFNGYPNARSASTASTTPPITDVQPNFSPLPTTSFSSDGDFLSTSLDDVTSSVPSPVYEHLGFLKEMGLDYGWGPTAMYEWILEHVHIYAGTPWWASLGLSVLLVRVCLLKLFFDSADATARNQLIAQYNAPIMARMRAAQQKGDQAGMSRAMSEMKALRASAGVKYWKIFLPFAQVPLGFGLFRLVRGMAHLPVPGFETGGLLWMQDLTLSDPYYILPVVTAASYWYTFKAGGESGATTQVNPTVKKVMLYVLPPLSALFMITWPGALQLTFFFQAMISMTQSAALRTNWFRTLVGIQPLPRPEDTKPKESAYTGTITRQADLDAAPEAKSKGIFGGAKADIQGAFSGLKKMAKDQQLKQQGTGRRTPGELQHARAYDERRKREIAQLKFEREQAAQGRLIEEEEKRAQQPTKRKH